MSLMPTHGPSAAQDPGASEGVAAGTRCQVAVPLASLRRKPVAAVPRTGAEGRYAIDPLQETQVLFCEEVLVREVRRGWARVEALEQMEFTHNDKWQGYPGWLPRETLVKKAVGFRANAVVVAPYAGLHAGPGTGEPLLRIPFGARVQVDRQEADWALVRRPQSTPGWIRRGDLRAFDAMPKSKAALRESVVRAANQFLGQPYLWGGRSPHTERPTDQATGVDCSGLVHLAYRVNGIEIPRDAHEQWIRSCPIRPREIEPADLIFLARSDRPDHVYHVLMSEGQDAAIEAVHEQNRVRNITFTERLGIPLQDLDPSGRTDRLVVRVGRILGP
jgi:cell wall-associated NlpC family hydrolase